MMVLQDKELIQKQKEASQQSQQVHKEEVQRLHNSLHASRKDLEAEKSARQTADVVQQPQVLPLFCTCCLHAFICLETSLCMACCAKHIQLRAQNQAHPRKEADRKSAICWNATD